MYGMGKEFRLGGLIAAGGLLLAVNGALAEGETDRDVISWEAVTSRIEANGAEDRRVAAALDSWRTLLKTETAGFDAYASFLLANPGWPDESRLRGLAERATDIAQQAPGSVDAFFAKFPARSAAGKAAHAFALARLGRSDAAREQARAAWAAGPLPLDGEQALLAQFSSALTPADHLRHADAVLWRRDALAAERVLPLVPATRQAVVAARIAFQRKAPDAEAKAAAADPVGVMDAGYLADKARWLSATGREADARRLLASRMPLAQTPADPEEWYEVMLSAAKAAEKAGDFAAAFAIASRLDDAYAPGTAINTLSSGERDDYTSLAWLAGRIALDDLRRPADAIGMFTRYAAGGQNAPTIAKGHYWAGRAALAAGRADEARGHFERAGAMPDQYYGQLALERLGRFIPAPGERARETQLGASERAAFASRPMVRAAHYLGQRGEWGDQSKFLRAIAADADTPAEQLLAAELSRTLGRPDLSVMAGRRATAFGISGYDKASFPRMKVPESEQDNWTMIHAIARQESQFDRAIVSYAGARGLMQLMPATAREQAGKNGVAYNQSALFDPDYNIALGSAYFRRMLAYYNGSYPLAVAAYNAGMGNVNKWLKANGDPRAPGGDIVRWVEDIPVYQTKDYVQRVLENAVVYDLVNPLNAQPAPRAPLSRYLGKADPG
jgi:soluble lytic murein transglycosylase